MGFNGFDSGLWRLPRVLIVVFKWSVGLIALWLGRS